MSTLLDVFNLILDIYGISELQTSGPMESWLLKIQELVNTEVKLMTNVQEIMGSMDLLFAVAENQTVPFFPVLTLLQMDLMKMIIMVLSLWWVWKPPS
uniref:Uncharacterized protein n=2 Tax=Arion vulgaris TaxID=1028688 RepID=A0A0B6ZLY4_9EUPU